MTSLNWNMKLLKDLNRGADSHRCRTANLHDLDDAHTQVSERFIALQDVTFDLQRAELGLLRSTGDLEKWALGTK
jgi:hypothetical protein